MAIINIPIFPPGNLENAQLSCITRRRKEGVTRIASVTQKAKLYLHLPCTWQAYRLVYDTSGSHPGYRVLSSPIESNEIECLRSDRSRQIAVLVITRLHCATFASHAASHLPRGRSSIPDNPRLISDLSLTDRRTFLTSKARC